MIYLSIIESVTTDKKRVKIIQTIFSFIAFSNICYVIYKNKLDDNNNILSGHFGYIKKGI